MTRDKSIDAGRDSFRKKGEDAVTQPGVLIRVCRYMYTSILNLGLVNSLQFTVGENGHLDSLCPRICTPAENSLGPGLSVVLLEQFVHSIGVRPYNWR